ncbi:TIGR01777 family oxidoreductase [Nocardioides sp. CCNWLW239]|uniref:TIGR01777 family oxidoreductase n=1 Tax=Nocardioides sp. CCNWLW239 TaxID=3128902 RepID=UPI0030190DCC
MKIVIPGGTGQVGGILRRAWSARGHEVVVLSRHAEQLEDGVRHVRWDGRTIGPWADEIDGADVVVNLAGRSVSCRYTEANLKQMMDSRVESTEVVGAAIAKASAAPATWLQMSTATIYAHRFDAANDEATGVIGGDEPDVPAYWEFSTRIARRWEAAQAAAETPRTRKVALRAAMVMSPDKGGVFDVLLTMTRLGLGGPVAGGDQFVSWIHEQDLVRACDLLIERDDIAGPVNLAAPAPVPQRELMRVLRTAAGVPIGLPATRWMAEVGAWVLRTDTELLLKSRRVVPTRLREAGFEFDYADWSSAAHDLVARARLVTHGRGTGRQTSRIPRPDQPR